MNTSSPTAAQEVLADLDGLRRRVDADRRGTSFPLITFGLVALGAALFPGPTHGPAPVYWLLAVPAAFTLLWSLYRRRQRTAGVGTPAPAYGKVAAVFVVVAVVVPGLLMLFGAAPAVAGVALALVGWRLRNWIVAAAGLAFGLIAGAEHWSVLSNRVHDLVGQYVAWTDNAIFAALGLALLAAGIAIYRREVAGR